MSDLISRQAAIDAFKKELTVGESKGNYVTICSAVGYEGVKQILESISPAQQEIIRCKDCKYGSPNGKYGCKCYHYKLYETHEMKPEDFCSYAERRKDG